MKILYLVNGISKTSIPWRWSTYFNQHFKDNSIELLSIKSALMRLWSIKKEVKIVHGHHIKAMALYLLINSILRLKTLFTVHGSYLFLSKNNARLLKFIFRFSDRVVFVNQILYDTLPTSYKQSIEGKYEVILNGVETNYRYKKTDIYEKFNIEKTDTICFHPARFVTEKNHIRLITAIKPLIEKNPKLKLVLAGNGELQEKIESHVKSLKLEKNVIFLGLIERDEVYNFLEHCELFLMPSVSEGLNIAFLEAISMKTKVLVSDIEQFTYPLKAYNLESKLLNVTFVDPLDENSISEGIESALEQKRNLTYDCAEFSLESMMQKYEKIYQSII
ncbi:glycosyltransferase family 4 protein [Sulfurovum sp. bin170]|uniref:glycosyltransferase family 4 protein n=1 Tax=Sulfurovum sp. bin170 TaxID=2695268 RepID=UPI0013DF2B69|nr:glycosyltransferase family 4 protein [Sulfurovum sp. bin170]NEW60757.1 glycosyltransferase family 4 protein [Sulfurovum sp. bin170]